MTLSVQLEEELGIELDTAVLWERPTLESLAEHLTESLNADRETITMSSVESAIIHDVRITSTSRLAATWIGASVIAVPLGVLLHELGHFLAYWAFGFQGVALHYSFRHPFCRENVLATGLSRRYRRLPLHCYRCGKSVWLLLPEYSSLTW